MLKGGIKDISRNPEFWRHKKIVLTGGSGFLGSHVLNILSEMDIEDVIIPRSSTCDLRNYSDCLETCKKAKDGVLIHLAADVGGIGYNREHPYDLAYNNLIIGANIVNASIEAGVKKLVGVGTICEYPNVTELPFKEENLWDGYPEETNAPYGLAKKMLLVLGQAAQQQYGLNTIHLLPVNLYGPGDNFKAESSHVIPALIKKFVEAKIGGQSEVEVWGTGKATREFLFVEDAASAIVKAAEKYNSIKPVNLGSGSEISIKDLAGKIKDIVGFEGRINWDTTKPDGQPRRILDVSRAKKEFGFEASTDFDEGLIKTIEWYVESFS